MSKKDFVKLAAAIKPVLTAHPEQSEAREAVRLVAVFISDACASSNDNFDRARFLAACGFNS